MASTTQNKPFLEKVMQKAGLPDIYDARDISIVVFRTMRDLMTTDASEQTAKELEKYASAENKDVAELWKDTNPIVTFLSKLRPPLKIDSELFMRRINQEAGLPRNVSAEIAIQAVFSATKDELSTQRVQEIAAFLPDKIKALWEKA